MQLKQKYEKIVDQYIKLFEKKHSFELEFWVADDKAGVACFGDVYFFHISDIMFDINNDLPKEFICGWLEDNVEYYDRKGQHITLQSYWKGLRLADFPDKEGTNDLKVSLFKFDQ